MTDNPSGATMVKRTVPVKKRVESLLEQFPECRGDDMQLAYRYYKRYSGIRITFSDFKSLRTAVRPETISRRRREVQAARSDLKPTDKTQAKRSRRERAFAGEFGKGMTLIDYVNGD